jgi:hypothetical protein
MQMILSSAIARQQRAGEQGVLNEVEKFSERARLRRGARGTAAYFIGSLLMKKDVGKAREYLVAALKENPMQWRAWLRLMKTYASRAQ